MMKALVDSIVSFFSTFYSTPKPIVAIPNISKTNSISFIVDEWNRLIIKVILENQNMPSCQEFGRMLYLLNNGSYEPNILNIMVDMSKKNPEQGDPIEATMLSWASSITDQMKSETLTRPRVRPMEVFSGKA